MADVGMAQQKEGIQIKAALVYRGHTASLSLCVVHRLPANCMLDGFLGDDANIVRIFRPVML
jgi:hypothetical protein